MRLLLSSLVLISGYRLFEFYTRPSNIDKNIGISPYSVVPIFILIFDLILLENLCWMRNAGQYIKNKIEYNDYNDVIKRERDFAQADLKWACFTPTGYILGIWLLSPALLAKDLFFEKEITSTNLSIQIIEIFLAACTFLVIFNTLGKRPVIQNLNTSKVIK